MSDQVPLLSVKGVARNTGLSRATIHRVIKRGELPSLKIGRRRLVRADALAAYLLAHEQQSAA